MAVHFMTSIRVSMILWIVKCPNKPEIMENTDENIENLKGKP